MSIFDFLMDSKYFTSFGREWRDEQDKLPSGNSLADREISCWVGEERESNSLIDKDIQSIEWRG